MGNVQRGHSEVVESDGVPFICCNSKNMYCQFSTNFHKQDKTKGQVKAEVNDTCVNEIKNIAWIKTSFVANGKAIYLLSYKLPTQM